MKTVKKIIFIAALFTVVVLSLRVTDARALDESMEKNEATTSSRQQTTSTSTSTSTGIEERSVVVSSSSSIDPNDMPLPIRRPSLHRPIKTGPTESDVLSGLCVSVLLILLAVSSIFFWSRKEDNKDKDHQEEQQQEETWNLLRQRSYNNFYGARPIYYYSTMALSVIQEGSMECSSRATTAELRDASFLLLDQEDEEYYYEHHHSSDNSLVIASPSNTPKANTMPSLRRTTSYQNMPTTITSSSSSSFWSPPKKQAAMTAKETKFANIHPHGQSDKDVNPTRFAAIYYGSVTSTSHSMIIQNQENVTPNIDSSQPGNGSVASLREAIERRALLAPSWNGQHQQV